jgi:membrane-bound lytic murein transglycosylase B
LSNETPAALLLPDGKGGQAFLIYRNFKVIRKYNASDYYALAVGSLGRMALS